MLSDSMEILLWNAPATRVAELDLATVFPDPAERSLMRVAARKHFRDHVLNWEAVVAVMVAVLKSDFETPERYTAAMPWFTKLVQDLSTQPEYEEAFPVMMQLWQIVLPRQDVSRIPFPVVWRLSNGTELRFNCILSSWNDFDLAGAFDWFPADASTATWLQEQAAEHPAPFADGASARDPEIEMATPIPAWNELLRSAREESGFTQATLAEAAEISEHAIFSYESGRRRPSRSTVLGMAEAMHLDGATTNLLLTGIGHAPVASPIARSIAGPPTSDPRYGSGRWQEAARQTETRLATAIDAHAWPCLVFDSQCRLLAANEVARQVLGTELVHQTLLKLLVSPSFREHVLNYDEVASTLAPRDLQEAPTGAVDDASRLPSHSLVEALAKTETIMSPRN
ncbi:MAG: helix-turn-helix domain-containing protein [Dehalococcoidia bacterium]